MKAAEMREAIKFYERFRVAMGQSLPLYELKLIAQTMFPAGSLPDEADPIGFTTRELEIIRNLQWKTEASSIAVGASCNINVNFTPTALGANSATISIADSATGSPQTVALTGNGVNTSVIAPAPLSFNPSAVGISSSSAQTITATFTLNGYAAGFTPAATLHYGTSFSIGAINCTGTANSETCSVPVTFQPQYPGGRKDALLLMNGTSIISTLLVGGIGQAPFALVQPGVLTQPILNGASYYYQSTVGEDGSAYVVNALNGTVSKITQAGVVTILPLAGLSGPHGIAIDGAGTLYIVQNGYNKGVVTYTAGGVQGLIADAPPSPYVPCSNSNNGALSYLYSVAVDQSGNLFTFELLCNQIFKLSPSGIYTTTTLNPSMTQPSQLAVDSADNVFVSGYAINELTAGGVQTQINTSGASDGLGVDAADTLYATRYSPTGGVGLLPASGYANALTSLDTASSPLGASVGPDGTVYVGNYTNVDKIDRSQGAVDFGSLSSGVASSPKTLSIYNGGNQPLTISSITISGTGYALQAATTSNCTNPIVVAPGALCQFNVILTPPHAGTFTGSVTIASNSLNNVSTTQTISLTGLVYGAYLTETPATLSFSPQIVNTTSAPQTATLTNNGLLYSAGLNGPSSSSPAYAIGLGTCSAGVAPGASCNLSITFTPTAAQTYNNATITVPYYSSGGGPTPPSITFTVNGTGTPAPAPVAALSPNPLAFPSTSVGSTATALPVTLSNTGNATLTGISASITGANPSDFAIASGSTCGTTLAAGASCAIYVSFTPASGTGFSATLSVADNASGSPQTVTLTGTGTAAPVAALSPNPLAFPSTTVGSTATALPVTLSNTGTAGLTGISLSLTGANPTNFATTSSTTCGTTLAAGATCTIYVSFTPASATSFSATLSVADNASGSPQTVTLTGTGTAAPTPQAALAPNPLAFPSTLVGTSATALPITLSNPGAAALSITSISVTGTNASSFGQSNTCGASLAAGANCTITVTFTPAAAGSLAAAISVVDNATGSPHTATLTGAGTAPQTAFTQTSLTFPGTLVGTAAGTASTTLSNPGTAPLTITGITITGANASSFSQSNNCGASLAAGATCNIAVTFTPTATGNLSASVSVADNATGSPQTVALTGTGTAPQATLSPNPLVFPNTTVGTSATALPLTLSNPGTAPLTITSISVTGANASSFSQSNNCGASLAAGATCTITVTFTPNTAATLTAVISVADNASGSPHSASLTGTGIPPLIPQAALSPNPLTFSSTTINTSSTLPMTLSNPGNAPLTITSISVTGANASSFSQSNNCGASLAAGATCTITVTFTPTTAATLAAAISVADNAAGSPQSAVITGTGSAGTFVVNVPTPTASVQPGATAQFNLTVAPLGGSYTNLVTLSATGLPPGATYSFSPPAVTPGTAGAPSVLSILTPTGLARLGLPEQRRQSPVPLLALLVGIPLLGFAGTLRRLRKSTGKWLLLSLAILAILPILAISGCGGGYFGPAPKTYTINVVGTSGSLQQSTIITLTVQ